MLRGYFARLLGIVGLFVVQRDAPRDLVVLQPHVAADAVRMEIGLYVFVLEVVTDVAVKFSIARVPGIPGIAGPDLVRGFHIASESGDARRAIGRRVDAVLRARLAVEKSVGFH